MTQSIHDRIPSLEERLAQEPQSPLFARLASHYLQAGRAQDALRICDEGLANYPFYSTGHLVKGKVLLELKMLAEAKREFEVVHYLLPTSELASQFCSSIDLGPSTDLTTTAVEEPTAPVEPVVAEGFAPRAQEETAPVEAGPQEVVTEEPVVTQPEVADFGVGSPVETPPPVESALEVSAAPLMEHPESYAEEENPFAAFGAEAESPTTEAPIEGEAYEEFAVRKRMELFGTEDTLSLDEYLGTPSGDQPTAGTEHIEELAEKLKTPKKIAPVINYAEKAPRPASEADTPAAGEFVTPTLAEIYVKQEWYDDAIKVYRALAINKPAEREKFEKRIVEIEEMKKRQQ